VEEDKEVQFQSCHQITDGVHLAIGSERVQIWMQVEISPNHEI
jgi:uncharacterized membrane protein